MASIRFTPPVNNAWLDEVVPFYTDGGAILNLLMLWDVGNGATFSPVQILQYNAPTGSFFDDTSNLFSGSVPTLSYAYNATVANFNGNGPGFVIAEDGQDQLPELGATDTLLLPTQAGTYINASANLPQTLAFTQEVSNAGVIDAAGDIAVFFNNIYSEPGTPPYYLISRGDGTFLNESASFLPAILQSTPGTGFVAFDSSALIDLTGDGLDDLIVGTGNLNFAPSLVYLNPGNGDFQNVTPIVLPSSPFPVGPGYTPESPPSSGNVLDIEPIHISSPNFNDLVVISTNGDYEGYAIQILINDGTGHFTDETATRLIGAPSSATYSSGGNSLVRSFIVNLNGSPDIVTQSNPVNAPATSQVFLNNGSGVFYLAYTDSENSDPIMAVVTISGIPTFIEAQGNLVPYESPPQVTSQTPTQTVMDGKAFSFTLASNTFTDPRREHLTYTASGPGDTALPSWITFNPATLTFSGTPPSDASSFTVMVTATDTDGWMTEENFNVEQTPLFPVTSGNNDEWILSDGQWEASTGPGSHPSGYNVAAVGDWTGNGTDGILWFDPTTGDTDEWQLSNTQWAASVDLGSHPGNYQISGAGDFFRNGISDVLWTSASGGSVQTDIWELGSNGQWAASVSPGTHPAGYSVAGIGEWTGSGTDGILWYNASTGDTDEWQLANGQWAASVDLGSYPGSGWTIAGVGDFFNNGRDDVLWTNSSSGSVQTDIWELSATGQWMASVSPGNHPAGYQVAGIGDFTGAGTSDILWYNSSTGDTDEWLINNGQWAGSIDLGSHPGNYQIAGTGTFVNGNSTSDILWHSAS